MRMSKLAIAAAGLTLCAGPALAQDADLEDARCIVIGYVVANQKDGALPGAMIISYFQGRIDGRGGIRRSEPGATANRVAYVVEDRAGAQRPLPGHEDQLLVVGEAPHLSGVQQGALHFRAGYRTASVPQARRAAASSAGSSVGTSSPGRIPSAP